MAAIDNITSAKSSTSVVSGAVSVLREKWAQYKVYRRTLNELNSLSGRELADLGLNHSMLQSVAYETAYGAK